MFVRGQGIFSNNLYQWNSPTALAVSLYPQALETGSHFLGQYLGFDVAFYLFIYFFLASREICTLASWQGFLYAFTI